MIVIRAELWPLGREEGKTLLGECRIANDGTGTPTTGHYHAKITKRGGRGLWKECRVINFPRRKLGVWDLLFRVLTATVGGRK